MAQAKSTANIGFEETLWKAADKLRGSMSSYDYKDVVLGLMFCTKQTIGIIICKRDNHFIMEYCSDDRIYQTTYELINL